MPSRLIGRELRALVYPGLVRLFLGSILVMEVPRQEPGAKRINYRHLVAQLVRKPGAFAGYVFREDLFPTVTFRKAYDALLAWRKERADKEYLSVLHHAAMTGETNMELALAALLEAGRTDNVGGGGSFVNFGASIADELFRCR